MKRSEVKDQSTEDPSPAAPAATTAGPAGGGEERSPKISWNDDAPEPTGGRGRKLLHWVLWLTGAVLCATGVGVVIREYRAHQAQQAEDALHQACAADQRDACTELCNRTPVAVTACVRLGKIFNDEDNPTRAVEIFTKACTGGSAEGCGRLGRAQYNGTGTARDLPKARVNLEAACQEGDPLGCTGLGHLLIQGQAGLKKDEQRGAKLFEQSCQKGEQRGCVALANCYLNGQGTAKDEPKALALFQTACEQGLDRGCLGKGAMLFDGLGGVERNEKAGVELLRKACDGDAEEGCAFLALAHLTGRGVERNPALALTAARRACDKAPPAGCLILAELTLTGQLGKPEPAQAMELFQRACDHGQLEGCVAVGSAKLTGLFGQTKDEAAGVKLIRESCEQGSPAGCTQLAMIEAQGLGPVAQDLGRATKRAKKACRDGFPAACTLAGNLLASGPEPQPDQAFPLFERGCQANEPDGCALMGALLMDGHGVEKDVERGLKLLEKACERLGSVRGCAMYARSLVFGLAGQDKAKLKKGVELAEKLCERGEPNSCLVAGGGYLDGRGVKRDMVRGARHLVFACKGKHKPACLAQERLPPALVAQAEEELAKLAASASASASAPGPPPPGTGTTPPWLIPSPGLSP